MGDDWLAVDKFEHFAACLLITCFVARLAGRSTRFRRWRIHLGALIGFAAGAAKEAADATGLWGSAGASVRDGVADMIGVGGGVLFELLFSFWRFEKPILPKDGIEEV
ncbi:hypothetical protein R1flu_003800 [Riccia fluitans]|uniref:Uncharacterized protein n=1 Tax=Riccia fluitans TaxID=41844 RepID=A0ABD1YA62_9MARC